mmetsp:Transcript_90349/g.156483  ORF Transcript_90349/g.156483 Transcript_90349/m.156483 type:complete len:481 (+) Transcript_90349:58-1500(+)
MAEADGKKPNLTGLRPRAFVSNTDTHLGTIISRTLTKKGDYEVWGTTTDDEEHECKWVKQIVRRDDEDDSVSKCLLQSDLIVHQLIDGVDDATTALKLLMNAHYETEKTFILVSSVMTWAETRSNAELVGEADDEEKEEGEEPAEEEEPAELEAYTEDMYNKRVPHVKYTAWKEVEKLCKKANSKTLHTYVVFSGLRYGEGEDILHPLFKQAWHLAPEGLPIFGPGKQLLPMVHVQDLATFVYKIASAEEPPEQRYYFGCDEGVASWGAIVKAVNGALGHGKTYKVPEKNYILYENVEHFIANMKVEAAGMGSMIDDEEEWVSKAGFVENIDKIVSEFKSHRKIQPLRVYLTGPPASGKTYYGKKIAEHFKLVNITVSDVVREFEAQQTQLLELLAKIKQRKKEERRRAKLEEKRRLKAEEAAERAAARAEAGEEADEGEDEGAEDQVAQEEEEELDEPEEEEEVEDDDEETEKNQGTAK